MHRLIMKWFIGSVHSVSFDYIMFYSGLNATNMMSVNVVFTFSEVIQC